jgi:hypothetical protein
MLTGVDIYDLKVPLSKIDKERSIGSWAELTELSYDDLATVYSVAVRVELNRLEKLSVKQRCEEPGVARLLGVDASDSKSSGRRKSAVRAVKCDRLNAEIERLWKLRRRSSRPWSVGKKVLVGVGALTGLAAVGAVAAAVVGPATVLSTATGIAHQAAAYGTTALAAAKHAAGHVATIARDVVLGAPAPPPPWWKMW